jgi:competence protein ComEC
MIKRAGIIVLVILISLGAMMVWQYFTLNDGKMHVIFCDVGQGDAVLIKTPKSKYILIDGGPDRSVIHCLSEHIPFWQRHIDLMLLTHPHADHFFGMFYVLERYRVKAFSTEDLVNKTQAYEELVLGLEKQKVPKHFVQAGDSWETDGVQIRVVGPTDGYLEQTSPGGTIGESKEFASLVISVHYGAFEVLLTGDSQVSGLKDALDHMQQPVDVLQVPHHGSASGLDETVLQQFQPSLAVVSVGADNRYNHPHPLIMTLLQSHQIKTLRTDLEGDIIIMSDGGDAFQIK